MVSVRGNAGAGGMPASFQTTQQPPLDLCRDTRVRLDHAVVHVVSQPAGLRDLRDARRRSAKIL
jgi:hypothetical protein